MSALILRLLGALILASAGTVSLSAEEFQTPSVTAVRVEWRTVLEQFRVELDPAPAAAANFAFASQRRVSVTDPRSMPALVQLNAVTSQIFNGIGRSPVPVLLPFDTAGFFDARMNWASPERTLPRFQADFRPVDLFDAGPAGYDATFRFSLATIPELADIHFGGTADLEISASQLIYDVAA
ncbi:MAG: M23 family peptidase, partial [Bradyrhizobium sp.]|nr:M23 family peptidase [Bradyrhizobium sp.]